MLSFFFSSYTKPSLNKSIVRKFSFIFCFSLTLLACSQAPDKNIDSDAPATDIEEATVEDNTVPRETSKTEIKATNSSVQTVEQPITILALGDSLTEGLGVAEDENYPAQLQQALQDSGYVNAKVINSGLSGETSSGLVNRLDWALKTKPDITILTIGANDAMRGIDVKMIEDNLRTAIERLQSEGSIVVLGGMQIYDNMGNEYVKDFSALYPKLAEEYDIALIPFFLEGVGGVADLNQADAIHPNSEGYTRIVNDNILPVLTPTVESFVKQHQVADNN